MADKLKVRHIDADAKAQAHLAAQLERAKTERVPEILTLALFVLFIAAFAISFWIVPDRDFSENENRTLEQFPKFDTESLLSGKFTGKFADYMADQFPLRDAFVGVKGAAEIAMLKSENNGVFVLTDVLGDTLAKRWLGDVLAERFDEVNAENVEKNAASIDRFLAACRERGVTAEFALFGRAMDLADVPLYGTEASDAAWAKLDGHDFVDMREAYGEYRYSTMLGGEYLYYRTDHHHTSLGAYYAYAYLAPTLGYEANDVDHYDREIASEEFYGTTWSKAGVRWIAPDRIEYFHWDGDDDVTVTLYKSASETVTHEGMYFREYLEKKDKYASFLENSVYGRVDVTSPDGAKPKLLVVKDSFAHSLVPFLAEHYDVTMIDPRYYAKPVIDLIDGEGFDAVLVCCNMATLSTSADFVKLQMGLDK